MKFESNWEQNLEQKLRKMDKISVTFRAFNNVLVINGLRTPKSMKYFGILFKTNYVE